MKILSDQYLAGLFDGEGCVSLAKYHPVYSKDIYQYCLRTFITNTNQELIYLLKEQEGGAIIPHNNKRDIDKLAFAWQLSTDQAYNFLKRLYPYLIIKKKQAEVAFMFVEHKKQNIITKKRLGTSHIIREVHEDYFQQMKVLNRKGIH